MVGIVEHEAGIVAPLGEQSGPKTGPLDPL